MPVVSLDRAKARVDISADDFEKDDLVAALLSAAQSAVEKYLARPLEVRAFTDVLDGNGKASLLLPNAPIQQVQSLTISGVSIPPSASEVAPGYEIDRDLIHLRGYSFQKGRRNVRVTYQAGYADMPPEIVEAVLQAFHAIYSSQSLDPNMVGESVGGVYSASYSPLGLGAVPFGARALLDPFRRHFR